MRGRKRQYHLFISSERKRCMKYKKFGVKTERANQISNVHKGDIAFFYERKYVNNIDYLIYRPVEIISEPSHRNDKKGYNFYVKFKELSMDNEIKSEINLWEPFGKLDKDTNMYLAYTSAINVRSRSVVNLLPGVGQIICNAFKIQISRETLVDPQDNNETLEEKYIFNKEDIRGKSYKEFHYEGQLETYLLLHPDKLQNKLKYLDESDNIRNRNHTAFIFNQVPTYLATSAIDIVISYKEKMDSSKLGLIEVFELKRNIVVKENLDQLVGYIEWTHKLFPNLDKRMIRGIIIGREFGDSRKWKKEVKKKLKEFKNNGYKLSCFTYKINENNDVDFDEPFP